MKNYPAGKELKLMDQPIRKWFLSPSHNLHVELFSGDTQISRFQPELVSFMISKRAMGVHDFYILVCMIKSFRASGNIVC